MSENAFLSESSAAVEEGHLSTESLTARRRGQNIDCSAAEDWPLKPSRRTGLAAEAGSVRTIVLRNYSCIKLGILEK
jgi:hypothetical protein